MRFVLDSSASLALLWQEKGAESILRHTGIYITPSLIYAETCIRLMKEGTKRLEAEPIANTVIDEVLPLEKEDTALILKFALMAREQHLSLADMTCIALAIKEKCPVITSDKAWKKLKLPVEVIIFR